MFCRSVSYEQGHEFVLAATGVSVGKRQLEQIVAAAAAGRGAVLPGPGPGRRRPGGRGRGPGAAATGALGGTVRAWRCSPTRAAAGTRAPEQRVRTFEKRAGTGEKKGCKRMAETGAVFDVAVPDGPARTPEQVMRPEGGSGKKPPRAQNRWYACDITAGRDVTVGKVFAEADRRDPGPCPDLDRPGGRGQLPQLGLFPGQPLPPAASRWPS